jgi:hypothetical protein
VYPCVREWYQFLSFGNGQTAPNYSLYSTIPSHIVKQIHNLGHAQLAHLCLGVRGRGISDEVDWNDEKYEEMKDRNETDVTEQSDFPALSKWNNESIVTTQCSNVGGVIEWAFVPFIVEDDPATQVDNATIKSDLSTITNDEL